jgi:small subunit ribosomal protein S8
MSVADPISDMLTRIRNAVDTGKARVSMPGSKMKAEVARVLKAEGFIRDFAVEKVDSKSTLTVFLRYGARRTPAIRGLRRISKPGLRKYSRAVDLPRILGGMGVAIVSTSQGLMTDKEARAKNAGGELLCAIW